MSSGGDFDHHTIVCVGGSMVLGVGTLDSVDTIKSDQIQFEPNHIRSGLDPGSIVVLCVQGFIS